MKPPVEPVSPVPVSLPEAPSPAWSLQRRSLFQASCIALIVTAMSFAIRGNVVNDLVVQFGLSKAQIGWITGTAFWGFTLAMIFGGPLCDVFGMRTLIRLAAVGHLVGIVMTIFAGGFWSLYFSTLAFGLGNGLVEAACNPLIATLYPDQKIKRLNQFHVWFPGGIVIGGLLGYFISHFGLGGQHGWQLQMATMLVPLAVYVLMFRGREFPATERVQSGVSTAQMWLACLNPAFLLFVVCMLMTAATELGTNQWLPNILSFTAGVDGILVLVWINTLMALGRSFAGPLVHRLSPMGVLVASAFFSAVGIYGLARAQGAAPAYLVGTIFAVGVCFFWPTMLGVVSERFPRTGALGLAIMGGAGMLSTSFVIPLIGTRFDAATAANLPQGAALKDVPESVRTMAQAAGGAAALELMFWLPVTLVAIFVLVWLSDWFRSPRPDKLKPQ